MARRRTDPPSPSAADQILESPEQTVLDLLDRLLNKGVMASGDLTIGVAGVDLIYLRLSALLCAADRVLPADHLVKRRLPRGHPKPRLFRQGS